MDTLGLLVVLVYADGLLTLVKIQDILHLLKELEQKQSMILNKDPNIQQIIEPNINTKLESVPCRIKTVSEAIKGEVPSEKM